MTDEDDIKHLSDLLTDLKAEDIDHLGVNALKARIEALQEEISRCEAALDARALSRAAAEAAFR